MTRPIALTCLLGLLTLLFTPVTRATPTRQTGDAHPLPHPSTAAGNDLPQDLAGIPGAGNWWATVQDEIARSEYNVTWQEQTYLSDLAEAYQAPNRAHNLRTYFTAEGIRIIPRVFTGDTPPWQWGLSLAGYGAMDDAQAMITGTLQAENNRLTHRRNLLTQWYLNDERGLEQGFILHAPPAAGTEAEVTLDLALSGTLTPQLSDDGRSLRFTTPGGATVLRYSDLAVTDANGRLLPAHLSLIPAGDAAPDNRRAIRITLDATGAGYPLTISSLTTSPGQTISPAWTVESDQLYAHFGTSVGTAGDVNGDGYNDIIIGAPHDLDQTSGGQAFVYHGAQTGPSPSADWTAESDQENASFGASVSTAGDVNGDGYSDVIVGAPFYDNGQTDEGRAFVYHGSPTGLSPIPAWTAESNQADAIFGISVATAGDINGDGYSDIIVGAPHYAHGHDQEGGAFVYYGSATGLSPSADWTAESDQDEAWFGYAVGTAGDVNGDGYSDVVIGAPLYDSGQSDDGRAYLYHGSATGLSSGPDWIAESDQDYAILGASVGTAGDVNGDGYSDVIIGAFGYDNDPVGEGRAFVYHGSAAGLSPTASWTAEGDQGDTRFSWSVGTAGDVNGDGYSDVIVGAPSYDNDQMTQGRVFVHHGSAAGLSLTATWTAESDQDGAQFGWSVATAGDVNGDGYSDIIIGAMGYSNGQFSEGRSYVYHGGASGLAAGPTWTAESDQASAASGWAVATAGDVNGDGYSDVIVGAIGYTNGETEEGGAFVYHGRPTGLGTSPDWTAESDQANAEFGYAVGTAGDVNGDGYSDVIIGAPYYDNGQMDEGRAFVYHGSAGGLSPIPDWTAESNQANARFGRSLATAGDVNGDGYSDVIVGAPFYHDDQTSGGRAYVYHGSATGLSPTAGWTAESDQANVWFSQSVGTAGDVNGDGYSDVIIGAPWYDNGQMAEGRAYLYHGSATGLSATADWTGESDQEGAAFGWSVGTAGDVNGDGYSDAIIGAPGYTNGQLEEGRTFVYHGSATGISPTPDWTAESDQVEALFGYAAGTAGDVNGDGYSDVIISAIFYDSEQTDEGRVDVYHGAATGLSSAAGWTAAGGESYAFFGASVGTAGDVNGDGYSDVIIGALHYDDEWVDAGRAYVYHGAATGLSTSPDWSAESDQPDARFGFAVGTAGDVNGNGYSDVIVAALYYDNDQTDAGRVFVYYGNDGAGLSLVPQQRRADDSAPVAAGGQSISPTEVRLATLGRSPYGRGNLRLQWEIKPLGTPFDGSDLSESDWQDSDTAGYAFNELAGSLAFETRYHWRVRLQYHPATTPFQPYSRWLSGDSFFTALSGEQVIDGAGITNLLGQSAYVDVTTPGSLDNLTLRGYPDTAHPQANSNGDGAAMLDRYFSLAPNEGAGDYALTLCLNYDDSEVPGDYSESDLALCRWTGDDWSCSARGDGSDTSSNLVCAENVSALNEESSFVLFPLIDGDEEISGLTAVNDGPTILGQPTAFTATIEAGTNVSYTWDFGDGSGAAMPTTTHSYAAAGVYTAIVTASNSVNTITATTPITITNDPPIAGAGPDQAVAVNQLVTLDGRNSTDPDGHLPLTYNWQQSGGPAVVLSDPAMVSPTFTAPEATAVLTFTLTVSDSYGLVSLPDSVVITVNQGAVQIHISPSALSAFVGETISYTYTISNSGSITLSDIAAHDDLLGLIPLPVTTLAPGEAVQVSRVYTITVADLPGPLLNTAVVTATSALGEEVFDSAGAQVTLGQLYKLYLPLASRP